MRRCQVEGCNGDASREARGCRGWCYRHYQRWRRSGNPLGVGQGRRPHLGEQACTIPGCGRKHYARGWCNMHYLRHRRTGDPIGLGHSGRTDSATPSVRADLRMAQTMAAHGRARDVEFYLSRAETHGRPLTRVEREFADGLRPKPDLKRNKQQLLADITRLTAKGLSAKQIGARLGVSSRTVVRYRAEARENGEGNA